MKEGIISDLKHALHVLHSVKMKFQSYRPSEVLGQDKQIAEDLVKDLRDTVQSLEGQLSQD